MLIKYPHIRIALNIREIKEINLIITPIKESSRREQNNPDPNQNLDCLLDGIILPKKKSHSPLLPRLAMIDSAVASEIETFQSKPVIFA